MSTLPGPAAGAVPVRTTNALAVVSLVTGIISYLILPIVGAIVAIITGHIARSQILKTGEEGNGLAMAGLILGYVHMALMCIGLGIFALVVGGVFAGLASAH